jgi:hypothetical protein
MHAAEVFRCIAIVLCVFGVAAALFILGVVAAMGILAERVSRR